VTLQIIWRKTLRAIWPTGSSRAKIYTNQSNFGLSEGKSPRKHLPSLNLEHNSGTEYRAVLNGHHGRLIVRRKTGDYPVERKAIPAGQQLTPNQRLGSIRIREVSGTQYATVKFRAVAAGTPSLDV
jgi:hypothetical protein